MEVVNNNSWSTIVYFHSILVPTLRILRIAYDADAVAILVQNIFVK